MTKKLFCAQRPNGEFVYESLDSYREHVHLWGILENELKIKRTSYALGEQEKIVKDAGYKILPVELVETEKSSIYCVKSPKTGIVPWAHIGRGSLMCWYQWGFDVGKKELGTKWAEGAYRAQQETIKSNLQQRGYSVVPVKIVEKKRKSK